MAKGGKREQVKLVIDASVVAKWVIPGEPWEEEASTLKNAIASGHVKAYAPTLIVYELASVILKAIKNNILKVQDGFEALKAIGSLGINLIPILWEESAEILKILLNLFRYIYASPLQCFLNLLINPDAYNCHTKCKHNVIFMNYMQLSTVSYNP